MASFRPGQAALVFRKELRETLRDRRSLFAMLGIPLVIYPLMFLVIGSLTTGAAKRRESETIKVAVTGAEHITGLRETLGQTERQIDVVQVSAEPDEAVRGKEIDAALVVRPAGSETESGPAERTTVEILLDRSKSKSSHAETRIRDALRDFESDLVEQSLRERGVPAELGDPLDVTTRDVASKQDRAGQALGMMVPMLLLACAALGAFYPAVASITTERETGLAEVMFVAPITRAELISGKLVIVVLMALAAASLNLLSMSLVVVRMGTMMSEEVAAFSVSVPRLVMAFAAAIPAVLLLTAAVVFVAVIARSYKEAGHYAGPVMLLATLPALVVMSEWDLTPRLALIPIAGAALVMRDVLAGQVAAGPILLCAVSHLACAAVLLRGSVAAYSPERWEGPAWEPLSPRAYMARARRAGAMPGAFEAVLLVVVTSLLTFYISPSLLERLGFVNGVLATEWVLIAAPALAVAWIYRPRALAVMSLRMPTGLGALGGLLVGVGAPAVAMLVAALTQRVAPFSVEDISTAYRTLLEGVEREPWTSIAAISVSAGVCEELLFRGPVLTGLRSRLSDYRAVLLSAVLFAAVHFDLYGLLPRTLLGIALGYVVVQTGSLLPAVLLHAANNAVALGIASRAEANQAGGGDLLSTLSSPEFLPWMGAGFAVVCVGVALVRLSRRPASDAHTESPR